jgi:UDP-glucuronate decarboxylase
MALSCFAGGEWQMSKVGVGNFQGMPQGRPSHHGQALLASPAQTPHFALSAPNGSPLSQVPLGTYPPQQMALVTGGAGFLGSHIVERLLGQGHGVIAVDNLLTSSLENLARFADNPMFRFEHHDVIEPYTAKVDRIYNFACAASPPRYQQDPIHTFKTNIFGALNAAAAAIASEARILQASTSEVYGEPHIHPQPEAYWGNVNPVGIRSCYDEGKRGAETVFTDFGRKHATDTRIARIFNTYGPSMQLDDGRVVSNFIVQALTGNDLTIYGDGSQTRSFCFVDDLVGGLMSLMEFDGEVNGPVNLGNPEEFTVLELAELVLDLTGSRSGIQFLKLPSDDPTQRRPDIARAEKLLGWQPTTRLVDGLKPTIAYFDKMLSQMKTSEAVLA